MTAAGDAKGIAASPEPPPRDLADRSRRIVEAAAARLFADGETTQGLIKTIGMLAEAFGLSVSLYPGWDHILLVWRRRRISDTPSIVPATPVGIHMGRVGAMVEVIERTRVDAQPVEIVEARLDHASGTPAASTTRFAVMAAAGAVALGVIFGVRHLSAFAMIALSAGLGGLLRRALADLSANPFIQPFAAALLAGLAEACAVRLGLVGADQLMALCPCMVLVPGPHLLNGAIDLVRARIVLGAARLTYASVIVAAICTGVLAGLVLAGGQLPPPPTAAAVAFLPDVLAAGVAVMAYATFFSLPWRAMPMPVVIGILAHSARWLLIDAGASVAPAAFAACLVAGSLASFGSHRFRLPFAGLAFASVVSMMPGVFLFRAAAALVRLASLGSQASADDVAALLSDGSNATLILLAMTAGVIAPRMVFDRLLDGRQRRNARR